MTFGGPLVQHLAHSQEMSNSSQIIEAWCSYVLLISEGGGPTTSLNKMAWYLTTLFKKNFLSNI